MQGQQTITTRGECDRDFLAMLREQCHGMTESRWVVLSPIEAAKVEHEGHPLSKTRTSTTCIPLHCNTTEQCIHPGAPLEPVAIARTSVYTFGRVIERWLVSVGW